MLFKGWLRLVTGCDGWVKIATRDENFHVMSRDCHDCGQITVFNYSNRETQLNHSQRLLQQEV